MANYQRVSPGVYQDQNGNIVKPQGGRAPQGLLSKPPQAQKNPIQRVQPPQAPQMPPPIQQGGFQGIAGQFQQRPPMQYLGGNQPPVPQPSPWMQQHQQEMGLSKWGTNGAPGVPPQYLAPPTSAGSFGVGTQQQYQQQPQNYGGFAAPQGPVQPPPGVFFKR